MRKLLEQDQKCALEIIQPHFKILDVGSHAGWFVMKMGALINPNLGGRIISFELNPFAAIHINHSIALNKFYDRIQSYNLAVSNETRQIKFAPQTNSQKNSLWMRKRIQNAVNATLNVYGVKLDDIWENDVLPVINFLHIDIETADILALQGA